MPFQYESTICSHSRGNNTVESDQSNYSISVTWWNSGTDPPPTSIQLPAVSPPLRVIRCARLSLEWGRFK